MKLDYSPLSPYSQKALVAFYEKNIDFKREIVEMMNPAVRAEFAKTVNPLGKIPALVLDSGEKILESTIIVEYLDGHHPSSGTRLIPEDIDVARRARYLDRFFDHYVTDPVITIFFDQMKPEGQRDPATVAAAKATLDKAYALADETLVGSTWGAGESFTLADCAAAPVMPYARMFHPFDHHKNLAAYAGRLAERPSYARVRDEAAPFMARLTGG